MTLIYFQRSRGVHVAVRSRGRGIVQRQRPDHLAVAVHAGLQHGRAVRLWRRERQDHFPPGHSERRRASCAAHCKSTFTRVYYYVSYFLWMWNTHCMCFRIKKILVIVGIFKVIFFIRSIYITMKVLSLEMHDTEWFWQNIHFFYHCTSPLTVNIQLQDF